MKTKSKIVLPKKLINTALPEVSVKEMINLPFKEYFLSVVGISIFLIAVSFLIQSFLPPQIPLYYGKAQGEEQLAPSLAITIPSLISLIIVSINLITTQFIESDFLKKSLIIAAISLSVLSAITVLRIVFLVGSF